MELTHLRYFIAVADELHFGRAAARLHMAQPPLSQQIKRLENELEVKLFNRTSRRVELTAAGEIFLSEARGIVERANKACSTMLNLGKGQKGYLSIAFNESVINTFLPETVKRFKDAHPEVQLSLNELGIVEQLRELDEKRVHLGFMRPFGYDTTAYSKQLVLREEYVLAMPTRHALCACPSPFTLDMLRNEPLILFPRTEQPYLRNRFDECFRLSGIAPNIIQEINSKRTTLALVKAGLGLSFVPESSMINIPSGIEFRSIDSDLPPVEIFALWRPENDSPLIDNLLKLIPRVACSPTKL